MALKSRAMTSTRLRASPAASFALALALPLALAFALYFPVLDYSYLWDDWRQIGPFAYERDPADLRTIIARSLPFSTNYYRPLVSGSFFMESHLHQSPAISHAINVLIHAGNCLLVFLLARRVLASGQSGAAGRNMLLAASLAASLYAVHPALGEAVAWVSGRFDLLCTTFSLLALLAWLLPGGFIRRGLLFAVFLLLALLAKEMAVVLPLALLFILPAMERNNAEMGSPPSGNEDTKDLRAWRLADGVMARLRISPPLRPALVTLTLACAAALLAYLAIRWLALGHLLSGNENRGIIPLGSPLERALLVGQTFLAYLRLIFFPVPFAGSLHIAPLPASALEPTAWAGLLALLLLPAAGAFLWHHTDRLRPGIALIAAGLAALLPALHLLPVPMLISNMYAADRVTVLPLALVCIGLAVLLAQALSAPHRARLWLLLLVAWGGSNLAWISHILPIWANDKTYWLYNSAMLENCSTCQSNFAGVLLVEEDYEGALLATRRAREIAQQPWQDAMATGVEALIHVQRGELALAVELYRQALALHPSPARKAGFVLQIFALCERLGWLDQESAEQFKELPPAPHGNSQSLRALAALALQDELHELYAFIKEQVAPELDTDSLAYLRHAEEKRKQVSDGKNGHAHN